MRDRRMLKGLRKCYPCCVGARYLHGAINLEEAWKECPQVEWMLWYFTHCGRKFRRISVQLRHEKANLVNTLRSEDRFTSYDAEQRANWHFLRIIKAAFPTPPPLARQFQEKRRAA